MLAQRALPVSAGPTISIAAITGLGAVLSAFMNNVGALALLMPVAIQLANRLELPPGKILMPLAFGTILGGMTTMIGTPPNLIVSGFRAQNGPGSFGMFDFSPVGLAVAGAGASLDQDSRPPKNHSVHTGNGPGDRRRGIWPDAGGNFICDWRSGVDAASDCPTEEIV